VKKFFEKKYYKMKEETKFYEGINEEVFKYFEEKKNETKEFLKEIMINERNIIFIKLLPKIILLHHKQREKWINEYVKILFIYNNNKILNY
jgi:hypothetical protein